MNTIITRGALFALIMTLAGAAAVAAAPTSGVVNVNTATAEQLAQLPRIGPSVAARIIAFREENSGFEKVEDLLLVRGIGERTLELLEPYVVIEGETTLTEKVRVPKKDQGEEHR